MESDEKTVVLDEVEHLLRKLSALPDDLKQVAFNKIQAQLKPVTSKITAHSGENSQNDVNCDNEDGNVSTNSTCNNEETTVSRNQKCQKKNSQECAPKESNVVISSILPKDQGNIMPKGRIIAIKEPIITRKKSREYGLAARLVEVTLEEESSQSMCHEGKKSEMGQFVLKMEVSDEEDDQGYAEDSAMKNNSAANDNEKAGKSGGLADDKENTSNDLMESNFSDESCPITTKRRGRPSKQSRNGKLYCKECNFETTRPSQLEIHKRKHSGFKPYACPECGKAFPHSSGLNVHIKRHKGQRDYPCDLCDYRAYTKIDKTRHMTVHTGERNHVCEYCGKAFAKDSTLREHVKSIHERKEKYVCEECGFLTYRANNLRVHIRMVHRGEFDNHVCPVCGAQVKQRSAFLEHMRAHTGERPFQCKLCPSSFACPARLTVHINSVHAPRSFPCGQCSKVFQTKHHLLRHQIIHTNERPFSCPFCNYACNTQGNMSKHVRAVHHKPDFSFRKHKVASLATRKSQTGSKSVTPNTDLRNESDENSIEIDSSGEEWVRKGQRVTEEYLKSLSNKLGREITLEELQAKEEEKKKRMIIEQYNARLKRINRISTPEHSYYSKNNPEKLDDSKKRGRSIKVKALLEGEEDEMSVDEPSEEGEISSSGENRTTIVVGTMDGQPITGTSSSVIHINSELDGAVIQHVSNSAPAFQTVYLPSGMVMSDGGQLYRIVTSDGEEIQLNSDQVDDSSVRSEVILETPEEEPTEPTVVVIINTEENAEA